MLRVYDAHGVKSARSSDLPMGLYFQAGWLGRRKEMVVGPPTSEGLKILPAWVVVLWLQEGRP